MFDSHLQRALKATSWAAGPMRWAVRFSLLQAPFKSLRMLPLSALCLVIEAQLFLIKK
jgi:hypothetical protein